VEVEAVGDEDVGNEIKWNLVTYTYIVNDVNE